jgi:RNA polymerase sigma-70 factor (ECF subfamily)
VQAHERLESQERVAARTPSDDFALVYETHFQLVFRTLQRFGVPASQVDDAVQDVFLVVCRGLAAFRGESSLKTWIFGITLRVATGYTRRLRRQTQPLDVVAELQDHHGLDPHELASRSEAVTALYAALAELDADKRAVFILAELEQLSVPEIAEIVGVNVNTAASRLRAGRKQFELVVRRLRARDEWKAVLP